MLKVYYLYYLCLGKVHNSNYMPFKTKYMEAIQIKPHNERMQIFARCVNIVNQFHKMGFENRSSFCEIVQEYDPSYKNYSKLKKLHEFWIMRALRIEMVVELESIIDRLKSE